METILANSKIYEPNVLTNFLITKDFFKDSMEVAHLPF